MPIRIVFDSNIYISAALNPGKYSTHWLEAASVKVKFELFTSPQILEEVQNKLENKLQQPREKTTNFIRHIETIAKVVRPTMKLEVIKNDPEDNKILECAVEAKADLIVTADKDLYKLKRFKGIGIVHPSDLKHMFPD